MAMSVENVVDPVVKKYNADTTVAAINKKFGAGTVMKLGAVRTMYDVQVIPTQSLRLNRALGVGGLPRGRIIEIYGPEGGGKSGISLGMCAEAQNAGGKAAFIDVECALDPAYAEFLGVDLNELYYVQPDSAEQALDIMEALIRSNDIDVVVLDSVAALVPNVELEGEMGTQQMGTQAKLMSKAMRKLTGAIAKTKTCCVFINQIREKIGCLSYTSRVTLADGSQMKIGKIVNQKLPVQVKTYNIETGKFEVSDVIGWFDNGNADEFLQITCDNPSGNGNSAFACTDNHPVLCLTASGEEYIPARDLQVGNKVCQRYLDYKLSPIQDELIIGSLLGDGAIRKLGNTYQYRETYGEQQSDYLMWKSKFFTKTTIGPHKQGGLYLESFLSEQLKKYRDGFYGQENKNHLVPRNIKLTPLIMAVWYMDDGGFCGNYQNAIELYTNNFPEADVNFLVSLLQNEGVDCKTTIMKQHNKNEYIIRVSVKGTKTFFTKCAGWIHSTMKYKIPVEFHTSIGVHDNDVFVTETLSEIKRYANIVDIYVKPKTRSMRKFDIEVAGTHNFLADGIVVHNSYGNPETTAGGRALKFYASVRIEVRRGDQIKKADKVLGHVIKTSIKKNKVAPPHRTAEYSVYYGVGIDSIDEIANVATEEGVVKKAGAWLSFIDDFGAVIERNGEPCKWQGIEKFKTYLRENPAFYQEIYDLTMAKIKDTSQLTILQVEVPEEVDPESLN